MSLSDGKAQARGGPESFTTRPGRGGTPGPSVAGGFRSEAAKIRERLEPCLRGKTVLDIGCGPEKVVPWALGVDDFSECAGIAEIRANVAPGGDLEEKLAGRTFDVVFSSHTLEHIRAPVAETLRHWLAFVQAGGRLALYLPDEDFYRFDPRRPEVKNPAHVHLLTMGGFMPEISAVPGLSIETAIHDIGPDRYSFLVVALKSAPPG